MTQVFIGKLPHGKVSVQTVADQPTREMAMLVVENQVAHEKRTRTLEKAMLEVQKKPSGTGSEELDRAVAKAKEYRDTAGEYKDTALTAKTDAVTAKNDATAAKDDAVTAKNDAVTAKNDAVSAMNDAVSAKTDAETAQGAAEDAQEAAEDAQEAAEDARDTANTKAGEAADSATAASNSATDAGNSATAAAASASLAANANIIAMRFYGMDLAANNGRSTFYLADFGLSDTSKTYLVTATFTNESTTARSVTLNESGTSGNLSGGVGKRCVLTCTVAGGGSFTIDNAITSVNVVICIKINS